jgi:hypothetical protein
MLFTVEQGDLNCVVSSRKDSDPGFQRLTKEDILQFIFISTIYVIKLCLIFCSII